ncbi:hypothetical protein [Nonomuraea sp. SBT364]|uniref:hypothetical protein n=1 Tax=Nonomuraea sp. SBT364 TaxID=1580530 RepID=UPI0012E22363|nr:hypothetical protein [Nonomuraea sp. SBT364]
MGSIASSSDRDLRVIHGPFFEEWEFATLMGFSRDEIACPATPREIAQVLARWLGDDGYDETAKGVYDRLR